MKKITKFLPLAMALLLVRPAMAADVQSSDVSTMQLNVPEFINIQKNATSIESASASFDPEYTEITLDKSMSGIFTVITNKPGDKVKLTATASAGGIQTPALFGEDGSNLKLVLTNIGEGKYAAEASAITNCKTSPAVADNANAICFNLTPTITPDGASGAVAPLSVTQDDTGITYTIDNGKYGFSYVLGTEAVANTFSTHDTHGTYKATLTLSQVSP